MNVYRSISRTLTLTLLAIVAGVIGLTSTPVWAKKGNGSNTTALSEAEAQMLTYMREEEKLARDVYFVMYDKWGAAIFTTIAGSEQRHMDTMEKMLDKYNLPDPVLEGIGQFTDDDLQAKYLELVESGSISYIDGLIVGATIEEIDMVDIQHAIDVTSHLDILTAYQNLLEGSKSHLRAYVKALASQGITYSPQFISQELFDAIIDL